ncbi:MAG: ribosome biogenesis GTPase YlqF, partial [Gammaproteobacteria bacterium]|nr:ribosome biogenesis GTPase YlqF [Gammaproteobacteria bacterium]
HVDLVIEVLDARLPFSSQNPMLSKLRGIKPGISILNKSDLADAQRLDIWQVTLEQDKTRKTLICNLQNNVIAGVKELCQQLVPKQQNRSSMVYAMIAGIPNAGKSTIINRLAGRTIAKTGNEAALTRLQQRIEISPNLTLIDTPGVLWPNIENPASGYRLAATGAIRDTALDLQDVAYFIAEFFIKHYPEALLRRYQLETVPLDETELLQAIARQRGCIVSGGQTDLEKVSRLLVAELRSGVLGPVCFETPQMVAEELVLVEAMRKQKAAKKAARKNRK